MAKLKFYLYNGGENNVEAVEDVLVSIRTWHDRRRLPRQFHMCCPQRKYNLRIGMIIKFGLRKVCTRVNSVVMTEIAVKALTVIFVVSTEIACLIDRYGTQSRTAQNELAEDARYSK